MERICTKCKEKKPFDGFARDKRRPDNTYPQCKACRAKYYMSNRLRILKQYSEYRATNAVRLKAQRKSYQRARFFYTRAANLILRSGHIKRDGSGIVANSVCAEISLLWKRQKGICPVTGRRLNRENVQLDHIIPIKRNGTSDIGNLRWVHRDVNYAKRDLLDEDFISLCFDVVDIATGGNSRTVR